jgi:hypothetical protein
VELDSVTAAGGKGWPAVSGGRAVEWSRFAIGAAVLAVGLAVVGTVYLRRRPVNAPSAPKFMGSDTRAPAGVRVSVELFNATKTRGLGRRAVMYLRDHGYDVVTWGTTPELRDTTVVIDRSGHLDWARLVARALGAARVETHLDSSRYVDVSVFIGATWRPPAQPFYP